MMWRALFLAVGIFTAVLGAECLVVDRFVMANEQTPQQPQAFAFQAPTQSKREVIPPEWAPWSLLSTGAVVIIYSLTLNKGGGP